MHSKYCVHFNNIATFYAVYFYYKIGRTFLFLTYIMNKMHMLIIDAFTSK